MGVAALQRGVLTPHLGFVCEPVFRKLYGDVVDALNAWLGGKPLPHLLAA